MPTLIKAKGLGTYHNELGLPEGSLLTADNIVIDRNDVIRPRRGLVNYGTVAACCGSYCQIIAYKDRILVHDGTTLRFDCNCNCGTFSDFCGSFSPLSTGLRIKSVESNGNLYFTTDDGIKKIAGTLTCFMCSCVTNFTTDANFITNSGGPKALDTTGKLSFVCGGFLPPLSKTAYRVVWGTKDANKNLILGAPSARLVLSNTDSTKFTREISTVVIPCCTCMVPCLASGDYFLFSDGSCNDFFVWYDETACFDACEPAGSDTIGRTAIKVKVLACDSASDVANKTANVMDIAPCLFTISVSCVTVTITNLTGADVCNIADGGSATSFVFATPTQGAQVCGISADVCITFSIPSDVNTTCFFYQVYRTLIVTGCTICCVPCLEPGEEMNLVFEASVTCADLSAGTITIKDEIIDCFRESGVLLYTNPVSGEGILQSNEKPPVAKDIELFREAVFFANTQSVQRKQFNFLAVSCFKTSIGPIACPGIVFCMCCNTILQVSTNWEDAGFAVGQTITVSKAADACNNKETIITNISGGSCCTLTVVAIANDEAADITAIVSTTSKFVIGNCTKVKEYTFVGEQEVTVITTSCNCSDALNGDYILLSAASNDKEYFFWFESVACTCEPAGTDTTGRIPIKVLLCCGDITCVVARKLNASICAQFDFTSIHGKGCCTGGAVCAGVAFCMCCNLLTRTVGSWIDDGFFLCGNVIITGLTPCANNGTFCVSAVTALVMTISAIACDVTAAASVIKEVTTFCAVAKGCLTAGDSFLFSGACDTNQFQFFYDFACAVCVPSCCQACFTNVKICITADCSACSVATTTACVIDAQSAFVSTSTCVLVTVTNSCTGSATDASDVAASTGYTFTVTTQGSGAKFNSSTIQVTNSINGNTTDASNGLSSPVFTFCVITCGDGEFTCCNDVLLSNLTSPAQSIDETARSLVSIINQDCCGIANAYYLSGEDDLPGIILLESRNLSDTTFYLGVCNFDIANKFNPGIPCAKYIVCTAACACKTIVTTATPHGLINNDCVFLYNTTCCTCLFGAYTVSCKCCNPCTCTFIFSVCQVHSSTTTGRVFKADEDSDNCVKPNRLFFSKSAIPEAVPLVNFLDVGKQDEAIQRILALRDNLFIMKEDGVYILTGEGGDFTVRLLGSSTNIVAPDSAAVLNNQIFMLSTQGVVSVSDTGIGVVSRQVEDKILDVTTAPCFCTSTAAFGISYESDRSYILWVPTSNVDTVATQAFRYNTFNKSWVRWTIQGRAGLVNPVDDKIYISSGNTSFIRQERKTGDRTDFADQQDCFSIPSQCVPTDCTLIISSICCVCIGDSLVQTQNVTLAKFDRLLRKLDLDTGLTCNDYICESICTGGCLGAALVSLHAKLDADDCTVCYCAPDAAPSTFSQINIDFDILVGEINCCSTKSSFHNYSTVCDTTEYEVIITGVCAQTNKVCISFTMPIIVGPIVIYKGINSVVEWAPQHFGDPSVIKQIPEGSVVFDGNNFFKSKIAYATDLSKDFTCFEFSGRGPGFWGGFVWNCNSWGGCGTDVPYRTLIPRNKQRCRYITAKFTHVNAREDFTILGISFEVRPLSSRGYRST